MLLSLFSAISSPFWRFHVPGTNNDCCLRTRFIDKEDGEVTPTIGLPKCNVDIVARYVPLFSETNPRLAEQDLTGFPYGHLMFRRKLVFDILWTNNMLNVNGSSSFPSIDDI